MNSNGSTWTMEALQDHLQDAIELELFTIPLYLCAMYSLKNPNSQAYNLIRGVVVEEMLHLELACNTLNALGGKPVLTGSSVASYPGNIPFHKPPYQVRLGPASAGQIGAFMEIELPTYLDPNHGADTGPAPSYDTIGEFYQAVESGLQTVNQFPGNPNLQASGVFDDGSDFAVTDLTSALKALSLIVAQGEGSQATHKDPAGELAHYWAFQEILSNPDWISAQNVYPLITDPNTRSYSVQQGHLLDFFDGCFSLLLQQLEADFNGNPNDLGNNPVNVMMFSVITPAAQYIVQQPVDDQSGSNLTPRFNYVAVTPASLQDLYNALTATDKTALQGVAQALGLKS